MTNTKWTFQAFTSTLLSLLLPIVLLPLLLSALRPVSDLNGIIVDNLATAGSHDNYASAWVNVTSLYTSYLPIVTRSHGRLYGQVFANGVPTPGISVTLSYCKEHVVVGPNAILVCNDELYSSITNINGMYEFVDVPTLITDSLGLTQTYQVEWINSDSDPNRLDWWHSRTISSYTSGEVVNIGNFDMAAVTLIAPAAWMTVTFPVDFRWRPRLGAPSDSYGVCIYGGFIVEPVLPADEVGCNQPLGPTDHFVLQMPFSGIDYGFPYWWYVQVFDPTGGVGESPVHWSGFWFASPLNTNRRQPTTASRP
jgi:hypothetical protein